jgi:hypothetical protein
MSLLYFFPFISDLTSCTPFQKPGTHANHIVSEGLMYRSPNPVFFSLVDNGARYQ